MDYLVIVAAILFTITAIFILMVPFFFIANGIVILKKEGIRISHMLSLCLGLVIFIGEILTVVSFNKSSHGTDRFLYEYLRRPLGSIGKTVRN